MKVGNISNVFFRGQNNANSHKENVTQDSRQIRTISNITPDFNISKPQAYKKLGETKLENGLIVHSYKLSNGYKISIVPMEGSPAVVKNYVNVGSMNETPDIKGISHFLEHMAFNGTKGENGHIKLKIGDSFKKIDAMGGYANASTNYAITDYINSSTQLNQNDLETQIKVIAAMAEDLRLSNAMIEKEKNPVCSEINMILDNPQTIAMDQTVRTLYNIKNPTDEMVGGSVKSIKNLTRKDVKNYYDKYYTPDNMNLVVTGEVTPDEVIKIVSKNFNSSKISKGRKFEEKLIPISKTIRKDFTNDKANSTEIILGFAGPKNNDVKERVAFDVAQTYLLSYLSGLKQNLKKYNAVPYIDSEKIGTNPNCARMTYLAVNSDDAKSELVLKALFESIGKRENITNEELKMLKQKLLKARNEAFEYSSCVNDNLGKAVLDNNLEYFTNYENILNSITNEDLMNALNKYFDLNKTAITLVHPPKTNNVSFHGKTREPINMKNVEEVKLANNFDIGLYRTKNTNFNYNISLITDVPYNKKAGAIEVLNEIYSMGIADKDEQSWSRFKEKNNLNIGINVSANGMDFKVSGTPEKRKLALAEAKNVLYQPQITQENLEKAKENIKDYLSRIQDSAYNIYAEKEAENSPYEFTNSEILKSLDNITLKDIKDCHDYILKNSRGVITANLPYNDESSCKKEILNTCAEFSKVKPNKMQILNIYKPNNKPSVLTKANNNSQADIMQVYKFKSDNTLKEIVLGELTNSILTSSSIGLFDNLREKQHLAYSVYSNINRIGNSGELSCNILTTTDNKDIGEFSYNNVEKSIKGFTNQITELKSGNFTDEDLSNAKLALKSKLLNNEGCSAKLASIDAGISSQYGIDYKNKLYKLIDKITKEDVVKFTEKVFKNPPTYSIVASQDTLEQNSKFLESLKGTNN